MNIVFPSIFFFVLHLLYAEQLLNLHADVAHTPFELGVASHDPLPDSILLWTRVQNSQNEFILPQLVQWSIWERDNSSNVQTGQDSALAENDFTLTIQVDDLKPNTYYLYKFEHVLSGNMSDIGRTRTAPKEDAEELVRIAGVSCASIWSGYMNAYLRIADREDLNLVVHVGDFIYPELDRFACRRVPTGLDTSCRGECSTKLLDVSQNENITDVISEHNCSASTISKFRWIYRYYLHDPALRAVRAKHPFVVMFDNHDLGSSRTVHTKSDEIQAFLDYLPMRLRLDIFNNDTAHFYRNFKYGKLVDIIALDTRAIGLALDGTYLGENQTKWLQEIFAQQTQDSSYRLILTTVAFAPWAANGWDDYVHSIFGGVLAALIVLVATCAFMNFWPQIKKRKREDDASTALPKAEADPNEVQAEKREIQSKNWKKHCFRCGIASLIILCIIWIVTIQVALYISNARHLAISGPKDKLQLIAAQERSWDGHPQDRRDFLNLLRNANLTNNNVWFSGDLHMSLAADVRDVDADSPMSLYTAERFGVEMLSSSVSRSNIDEIIYGFLPSTSVATSIARVAENIMYRANPHFKYFEGTEHGYGILQFSKQNVTGEFWHQSVDEITSKEWLAQKVFFNYGENEWRFVQ